MILYKVVKKQESPTIPLNKINMEDGFIIVKSDDEAIGIIIYDTCRDNYIMINDFKDNFERGINPSYYNKDLENLIEDIKMDYNEPVELNFVKIEP